MKTSVDEVKHFLLENDYCAMAFCGKSDKEDAEGNIVERDVLRFKIPGSKDDQVTEMSIDELTDGWLILTINENIYTCRTYAARVLSRAVIDVTLLGKFSYDPRFTLIYDENGDLLDEIDSFCPTKKDHIDKERDLFYAYDELKKIVKYPEYSHLEKEERDDCIKDFKEFYQYSELKPSIDTIKDVMAFLYDNLEEIL